MRHYLKWFILIVAVTVAFGSVWQSEAWGRNRSASSIQVTKTSLVLENYEFGPGVSKVVLETNANVRGVALQSDTSVTTAGVARQVKGAYLSDAQGNAQNGSSRYLTLELEVGYNPDDPSQSASPLTFDLSTYRNKWVSSYVVAVSNLSLRGERDRRSQLVSSEQEAIANKITPTADRFSERGTSSLAYAAYQPQNAAGGEKNPLIVWLHGIGEAGTDLNLPLLASEVTALTQDPIQSHFSSTGTGYQKGAHVLVPQSPSAWVDDSFNSQYAESLKTTIDAYVSSHPDVDANRIYLAGASNGGGMTLKMGTSYPDYFAALIPIASPYPYQTQDDQGKTVYRLDDATKNSLKDQPMWLIHTANDASITPDSSALPFYKTIIDSGAENKWISYYESAIGTDLPGTNYNGHWSWIYFFNDQVTGVQNTSNVASMDGLSGLVATNPTQGGDSKATVKGIQYSNIFDWMNAQSR